MPLLHSNLSSILKFLYFTLMHLQHSNPSSIIKCLYSTPIHILLHPVLFFYSTPILLLYFNSSSSLQSLHSTTIPLLYYNPCILYYNPYTLLQSIYSTPIPLLYSNFSTIRHTWNRRLLLYLSKVSWLPGEITLGSPSSPFFHRIIFYSCFFRTQIYYSRRHFLFTSFSRPFLLTSSCLKIC